MKPGKTKQQKQQKKLLPLIPFPPRRRRRFPRDIEVCGTRSKGIPDEGALNCQCAFRRRRSGCSCSRKLRWRRRIKRKSALITAPPPPATINRPCVPSPTFDVFFLSSFLFFLNQQELYSQPFMLLFFVPSDPIWCYSGFSLVGVSATLSLSFMSCTTLQKE